MYDKSNLRYTAVIEQILHDQQILFEVIVCLIIAETNSEGTHNFG